MQPAIPADDLERQLLALSEGLQIVACRALGAADAQDVVQETLARAIAAIRAGSVPDYAPFPAFVHGICRHVVTDALRQRARERAGPPPDDLAGADPHPLDTLARAEQVDAVARAVAQLPRDERELLRRCFVEGARVVDIAASAGEPPERVRKRKSRALQRLRELLGTKPPPSGHGASVTPIVE